EVIHVARTASSEGKQDYQLLAILGEALIRAGASPGQAEFAEARDALEKSVAARPNYASSQIGLGHADLLDGRLEAAIEHLKSGDGSIHKTQPCIRCSRRRTGRAVGQAKRK